MQKLLQTRMHITVYLHMIQGDLSDRGDVSQCLQCVLCKMRDCAQVRVEQAAWDFQ